MEGGIPDEVSVYKLIQSHAIEINALKRQCKTKQCKQSQQRIPRHMRRRAASNNPKRLPKSLQIEQQQIKSNDVVRSSKHKRKRKTRRKATRNSNPKRTLLHIWFAKRFKLELRWDKLLPLWNNVKNQRSLYRCSRKGYTIFYLPFVKSLLLDYGHASKQEVCEFLSKFCSQYDAKLISECDEEQQCNIYLHEYEQHPRRFIGPVWCVWLAKRNCFWLSVHQAAYQHLEQAITTHLPVFIRLLPDLPLSYIRLFGPKALSHLNRTFFRNHQQTQTLCKYEIVQLSNDTCQPLTEQHQDLATYIQTVSDHEKKDNQLTMVYRKHCIDQIETVDVLVANVHLKTIWNRLTANKCHLVGGLRDLEVMTLNTGCTLFPLLGYCDYYSDQPSTSCTSNDLVDKWKKSNSYVLRDKQLLGQLSNLSLDCLTSISNDEKASTLLYLTVDYVRGTARKTDLLYLPDCPSLKAYLDGEFSLAELQQAVHHIQDSSPLGFVEYGSFSMQAAKCRAIAVVTLLAFEQLIIKQKALLALQSRNNTRLYALARNEFAVHLVTVTVRLPSELF